MGGCSDLDLGEHVAALRLPAPGDEAQLLRTVEQLRRRRLDRVRPLWQMWFLTGLPDSRLGLFVRMHHAMADGMAGVAAIAKFLDATRTRLLPRRKHGYRHRCPRWLNSFKTSDAGAYSN